MILAIGVADVDRTISKSFDTSNTSWSFVNVELGGSKEMKFKFEDIKFKDTDLPKGIQALLKFGEYELSIVKSDFSYGGNAGLYEIAVFKGNDQVNMPGITEDHDTVKGYLTEDNVVGIIKKMHLVSGADPEVI